MLADEGREGRVRRRCELPAPVMAFAFEPKTKGDEEKAVNAIRRLEEEDPTLDVHRDQQTGEQIIAGLTQIHVEVIVDRMKEPLRRRDRAAPAAGALPGGDPQARQGPRPLQEADRRPRPVRRLPHRDRARRGGHRLRVRRRDQGRLDPQGVHPRGREGHRRGDAARRRSPATRSRTCSVRLFDGQYHRVDSSENAFKVAGSMAFKDAMENSRPGPARADHAAHGQRPRGRRSAT